MRRQFLTAKQAGITGAAGGHDTVMSTWHVWGDYVYTKPDCIGNAKIVRDQDRAAEKTAEANGFDFKKRVHNGFEPWAATYISEKDDDQEFAFASLSDRQRLAKAVKGYTSPARIACTAACERAVKCRLEKMLLMWFLTVFSDRINRRPMSRFDSP